MSARRQFRYRAELPDRLVVPEILAEIAARHGSNDFIVASCDNGSVERITYAKSSECSADMAARLIAAGVTKGVRVGILAPNGPDFVVAFLAVTRIGAVAVPLNSFFRPRELAYVLRDADVHTLLAVDSLLGKDILERIDHAAGGLPRGQAPLFVSSLPNLRNVFALGATDRAWPSEWPDPVSPDVRLACESLVRPADDFVIVYTSGSTADPKGIIHVQGTTLRHSHYIASEHGWTPADRVYVPMAFFWVGGLLFGVLGALQLGVTILTEHRFDAAHVLRLLAAEGATYATGFPHVGPALVNHADYPTTDLSSLREGYQQTLVAPEYRTPDPSLRVRQLGMTETCSSHTWWPPHEELPEAKRGSVGVAGPGFEHKIVDELGSEVEDGVSGEICVRGYAMMRAVVGKVGSEVFDPDGWYHTGDFGYRDTDGHLYFGGRKDDMIKTSGANVAPIEVESTLGRIDAVRVAYVIGSPDPDRGAVVTAVVVLNDGFEANAEQLTEMCKAHLSAYKVPKKWILLKDPEGLPYTTTNKIDKVRLTALVSSGTLSG